MLCKQYDRDDPLDLFDKQLQIREPCAKALYNFLTVGIPLVQVNIRMDADYVMQERGKNELYTLSGSINLQYHPLDPLVPTPSPPLSQATTPPAPTTAASGTTTTNSMQANADALWTKAREDAKKKQEAEQAIEALLAAKRAEYTEHQDRAILAKRAEQAKRNQAQIEADAQEQRRRNEERINARALRNSQPKIVVVDENLVHSRIVEQLCDPGPKVQTHN